MYVGSDTSQGGQGIYLFRFHPDTGNVEPAGLATGPFWQANADDSWSSIPRMLSQIRVRWPKIRAIAHGVQSPAFIVVHPNGRYLYSSDYQIPNPCISAFRIDPATGKLTMLNSRPTAKGGLDLAIDKTGRDVLVSRHAGGSIVLPINADGSLREVTAVVGNQSSGTTLQRKSGPRSINLSPDNRFAAVVDIGLERVYVYRFDSRDGTLAPNDPPFVDAVAGERHLSFDPNGKFAWLISEQGAIQTLAWNAATGVFLPVGTVRSVPEDFRGLNTPQEIRVHPNGKFLYSSNAGHDSIAVFAIDPGDGTLTPVEYVPTRGIRPQTFAIDPSGRYMFVNNEETRNVVEFRIDPITGRLEMTGTILQVPHPLSVAFAPPQ
jgi:6-phosphogluconolactonase